MFSRTINSIYKLANLKNTNGKEFIIAYLVFARNYVLRLRIIICVTKATKIIRETFQYPRKMGSMFSLKEGIRNGNAFC